MATVKTKGWGGPRRGAGRSPQLTEEVRRNRVVVLLTDEQLETLQRLAEEATLPTGTLAYQLLARGLARRRK